MKPDSTNLVSIDRARGKVRKRFSDPNRYRLEKTMLEFLGNVGFPVPELLDTDDACSTLVMEYRGERIGEGAGADAWKEVAILARQLHELDPEMIGNAAHVPMRLFDDVLASTAILPPQLGGDTALFLSSRRHLAIIGPQRICHRDLRLANCLVDAKGKTCLIDFEHSVLSAPTSDIARVTAFEAPDRKARHAFIEAYCFDRKGQRDELIFWETVFLVEMYSYAERSISNNVRLLDRLKSLLYSRLGG